MPSSECVALQDPYCAWDKNKNKCRLYTSGKEMIQNVSEGVHSDCGNTEKKVKPPAHSASINRESSGTLPPIHNQPDVGGMFDILSFLFFYIELFFGIHILFSWMKQFNVVLFFAVDYY